MTHTLLQRLFLLMIAGTGLLVTGSTLAGPLEDAAKLIAEGKYDEVDKTLSTALSSRKPDPKAVAFSLQAAEASGRYVTANQRIATLLFAAEAKDHDLLLRGARIAHRMGNSQLALSRYFQYTQLRNEDKSPEVTEALLYLMQNGNYPAEYIRFLKAHGADEGTWTAGRQLLTRLLQQADADNALKIAKVLLENFQRDDQIYAVHGDLRNACDNFLLGRKDDRYVPALQVMLTAQSKSFYHIGHVFRQSESQLTPDERIAMLFKMQDQVKSPMSWDPLYRFPIMRELDTDQKKVEAGRKFLSYEPLFRDSDDPNDYYNYLRIIIENPHVFKISDKTLVGPKDMVARLNIFLKKYEDSSPYGVNHHVYHALAYYLPKGEAERLPFLKANLTRLWLSPFEYLVRETDAKELPQQLAAWRKGKSYQQIRDMNSHLMPLLSQYKAKDLLMEATHSYLMTKPSTFDRNHVNSYFCNQNELFTPEERLALLSEISTKGGYSPRMEELLGMMEKNDAFKDLPAFKKLQEAADNEENAGSDPYLSAYVRMHMVPNDDLDAAWKILEGLLAAHKGPLPGGPEATTKAEEVLLVDTMSRPVSMSWNIRDNIQRTGDMLIGRMGVGSSHGSLVRRMREHGVYDAIYTSRHVATDLAKVKDSYANDFWFNLSYTRNPEGELAIAFPEATWASMGSDNLFRYMMHNWATWDKDRPAYNALLDKIVHRADFKSTDRGQVRTAIDRLFHASSTTTPTPATLTTKLWAIWKSLDAGTTDYYAEAQIFGQFVRSGHDKEAQAFIAEYYKLVATRSVPDQILSYANVLAYSGLPLEEAGQPKPFHRLDLVLNRIPPLIEKLPAGAGFLHSIPVYETSISTLKAVIDSKDWPEDVRTKAASVYPTYLDLLLDGGRIWGYYPHYFTLADSQVKAHVEAKEYDQAADVLGWYARNLKANSNWDTNYHRYVMPISNELMEVGAHELAFGFVDTIEKEGAPSDEILKQLAIVKAKAAQYMVGVVTVNKNDPSYVLQQAAFQYALGNEAKAWDLTSEKLKLLPEVWQGLDQQYVAWTIEQMRKQKMLDLALKFCFLVLLQENDLDIEVAATISLTKGDIYRDMENYQAARIEYQALMSNRTYKHAKAGFKAQFRLIELLILTKDYVSAEQNLERLVNVDDLRIQAEAYYLYAKMMFDQKAYKEAAEYIRKVKDRVVNHVEAAFLQGELNLRMPGGLQHTEVPVGNPRLSTVAIPGRDLTLKLQDSNLAIAREKGSIPVIVTTSEGKDEERVKLLPSPTNRNLFEGVIATSLGEAAKLNLRLELRGDDIVSYVIDPEFQKANDIDYPPKQLVVKSDARLVASSGEILSEEEEEEREMQRRMMETRVNVRDQYYFRNPRTIRPGNPIHVQVRDFDRDVSSEKDKISISLSTFSGDALDNFQLVETEPHSGIFRGAVPTGIPFPKVTVSDTREDRDPSLLINSGKKGEWASLADGKKPKWIDVDTMSSDEVSEVSLEVPNTAEFRRVTLMGMLSDDYQPLASYPEQDRQQGPGAWVQYYSSGGFADNFATRHTGLLRVPADGEYTIGLSSDDGSVLYLDGKKLIDNDGVHGVEEKAAKVTLKKGDHPLRVEHFEAAGGAALNLYWTGPGVARQVIPASALFHTVADKAEPGLKAEFFRIPEGTKTMPDMDSLKLTREMVVETIDYASTEEVWPQLVSKEAKLIGEGLKPMVVFDWRRGFERPASAEGRYDVTVTGSIIPRYTETYTLYLYGDDGIRLTLGDEVKIDEWRSSGHRERSVEVELKADEPVPFKIEYYDRNGDGILSFSWSSTSQEKEWIPQSRLLPPENRLKDVPPVLPITVQMAYNQHGHRPEQIQTYLRVAPTVTWRQESLKFDRNRSPWPWQSWYTSSMSGAFYLPENRTLELKFSQEPPPHAWQYCYIMIDGEVQLGMYTNTTNIQKSKRVQLVKGVHSIKILNRDHWGDSGLHVQYRQDDGTFADLPMEWFDPAKYPELAEYLQPAAKVDVTETKLTATLNKPRRLRRLRWVFEDFTSADITASSFTIKDAAGKTIVPGANDFTSATTNNILEISPGDSITVNYEDTKRLREETPVLSVDLNSQYHNGEIILANEEFYTDYNGNRLVRYQAAKRCKVGDQISVLVEEYDADITDKRDTVDIVVSTSSGEKITIKALETMANYGDEWHPHAGRFLAILRIGETTDQAKETIGVKPGDLITATYLDSENTKPGIPIERSYSMTEGGKAKPEFLVYRTSMTLVEDKSTDAQAKLERLRKKFRDAVIFKAQILARHPQYRKRGEEAPAAATSDAEIAVDVNSPLMLEVNYPKLARHAGSELTVRLLAQSEVDAAKAAGREAEPLEMPMHLYGIQELARIKGYDVRLESHLRRDADDMLADGTFAGVVRLQVGSPGDAIDDLVVSAEKEFATDSQRDWDKDGFHYRVPTLLVSGSDTITLQLIDDGKVVATQAISLRANGRMEMLERTYTVPSKAIYLGESFYLKITDPDRDVSNEQDEIKVTLKSESGDQLVATLSETLAHTGVFTGSIEPKFIGETKEGQPAPTIDTTDDMLQVQFGDEVTITYIDPVPLTGDEPLEITQTARIHYGSDSQLASFSKNFKDPEMAVKTRFLMAEALFEMAKQNRKLKMPEKADEHIAAGKTILEEAMRDYPDTSLASQGEFLLANLAEELDNFQEAIGRYSHVIRTWPESEYASRSQFKKALCLEKMENYDQACEEYVRLTYVYPESNLVADAVIRLASYYYQQEKFAVASKIFHNFQTRNPDHKMAPKALFLASQCQIKQKDYDEASRLLETLINQYDEDKDLRAEGMYWLGDSYYQQKDYMKSYQNFKKLTWDYPESKWAKYARGRLTDEQMIRASENEN